MLSKDFSKILFDPTIGLPYFNILDITLGLATPQILVTSKT